MSNGHLNKQALTDDNEANVRFAQFQSKDPFPSIDAALLNSADIHDYIIATGMICPYEPERKLKSASYEILFNETQIIYWDEDNKKQIYTFKDEQNIFPLKKNSIIYASLITKFRVPDYIALRFNLRINLVHKGLLLGTGPLVDPGFEGNLLIPVHNLTANNYELRGDEGFIWIEFTKISKNTQWSNDTDLPRAGSYVEFPEDKKNLSVERYFESANKNNPIQSSIPGEVKEAKDVASNAKTTAQEIKTRLDNIVRKFGWGSFFAILIAIIFGVYPLVSLLQDSISYVKDAKEKVNNKLEELKVLEKELQDLRKELLSLKNSKKESQATQKGSQPEASLSKRIPHGEVQKSVTPDQRAIQPKNARTTK